MNLQTKQRIIGAVIGVIFLAIAIPFLLSGARHKQQEKETGTQTTSLSLPQTTETPSTLSSGAQQLPTPDTAAPITDKSTFSETNLTSAAIGDGISEGEHKDQTPMPVSPDQPLAPITATSTPQTPSQVKQPAINDSQDQNPALRTELTQQESKTTIKHTTTPPQKAALKTTHKKVKTAVIATTWIINAGAYKEKTKAQNLLQKLKKNNYHATIQTTKKDDKTFYHVIVGPAMNNEKATAVAQKITKVFGIKTKLVPVSAKTATKIKVKAKAKKNAPTRRHLQTQKNINHSQLS